MPQEYPLAWPAGWPRARSRRRAAFKDYGSRVSFYTAEERVRYELERLAVADQRAIDTVIISTNQIRDRAPADPGAAVYFQLAAKPMRVVAIDIYDRVADNVAAIAATLDALRAIDRHGGAQILERAFTGFDALPAPKQWWDILGLNLETLRKMPLEARRSAINGFYRSLMIERHPDNGGSHEGAAELNQARDAGLKEIETL